MHSRYMMLRNSRQSHVIWNLITNVLPHFFSILVISCFRFLRNSLKPRVIHPDPDDPDIESRDLTIDDRRDIFSSSTPTPKSSTGAQVSSIHITDIFNSHDPNQKLQTCNSFAFPSAFEKKKMLQQEFRVSVTSLGKYHGSELDEGNVLASAMYDATAGSVWDTSHPFAASLCKPYLPILFCFGAISAIHSLSLTLLVTWQNNEWKGRRFRFTALQLRSNQVAESPCIASFGLMLNGCLQDMAGLQFNMTNQSAALTISFEQNIVANGWWLQTSSLPEDMDPIRFYLEASSDEDSSNWNLVGSSTYEWTWAGKAIMKHGPFDTSSERLHVVKFDMQLPWIWSALNIACDSVLILMFMVIFICILYKRQMRARWAFSAAYCTIFFCELLACIDCCLQGFVQIAFVSGVFSIMDLVFSLIIILGERLFRTYCGLYGIVCLITLFVHYMSVLGKGNNTSGMFGPNLIAVNRGSLHSVIYITIAVTSSYLRYRSHQYASQVIAEDQEAYAKCWHRLVQLDVEVEEIEKLHVLTSSLAPSDKGDFLLQISLSKDKHCANIPQVMDLDQLFAMAAGLHPYLRCKVQEWAALSRGFFQVVVEKETTFLSWDVIAADSALYDRVKWALPKTRKRAIEKVFRSYNGDVSRLLDCCRQVHCCSTKQSFVLLFPVCWHSAADIDCSLYSRYILKT